MNTEKSSNIILKYHVGYFTNLQKPKNKKPVKKKK